MRTPICGVLAGELEIVGERCLDGGKCHHGCASYCSRRCALSCVPLTGSCLTNQWTIPSEYLEDSPLHSLVKNG